MSIPERVSLPSAEKILLHLNTYPYIAENDRIKKFIPILANFLANSNKVSGGIQSGVLSKVSKQFPSLSTSAEITLSVCLVKALKDCANGKKFEITLSSSEKTSGAEEKADGKTAIVQKVRESTLKTLHDLANHLNEIQRSEEEFSTSQREIVKLFLTPSEDVFSLSDRGTVVTKSKSEEELKVRQETESIDPSMLKIERADAVAPLAGRLIAFRTNSYYFGSRKGYPIDSDASLKFGYVSADCSLCPTGEDGYGLTRLLKPDEVASGCLIIDSRLNEPLLMRLATLEETNKIRSAVESAAAKFEYATGKKQTDSIINQHIAQL